MIEQQRTPLVYNNVPLNEYRLATIKLGVAVIISRYAWFNRLTPNQEVLLEETIGSAKKLDYKEAIERVEKTASRNKTQLIRAITEAAEKAGCTGTPPIIDDGLIVHMKNERMVSRK